MLFCGNFCIFVSIISIFTRFWFTQTHLEHKFLSLSFSNAHRSRGIATGVAAAINYIFGFITKKTYYNLETALSLPGISMLFTWICIFGLILTYKILPETENRTLEDIERHFADNSRKLTDRKIAKAKQHKKKNHLENGNADKICTISMATAKVTDNGTHIGIDNRAFQMDKV